MISLIDDYDRTDNAIEASAGKPCDLINNQYCISTILSTVDNDSDQGSSDIQWFAMHFLVLWYRDVMCSTEEQNRIKCGIREVIITKLTSEVSKLPLHIRVCILALCVFA